MVHPVESRLYAARASRRWARVRILSRLGRAIPASEFARAVRFLQRVARQTAPFFERYDVVLTPTVSTPPFAIGAPMDGGAVGEVTESRSDSLKVGDMVLHMQGWRDEATGPAAAFTKLPALDAPPQAFLGRLGMPGMTAYFGLLAVAEAKEGDTVFVSAAAGAVGSTVVQIAKAKGMTVIG